MKELFMENNEQILEKFEIILDRAKSEKTALSNSVDYYLCLLEDDNTEISVEEVIELAEFYGYDFSNFEELVKADTNYEL
jgi:hypothetical protein